jgi:hypothetical protein
MEDWEEEGRERSRFFFAGQREIGRTAPKNFECGSEALAFEV